MRCALCSARLASGLYTSYNEHFQSNLSKSIIQRRLITLSSKHIFHSFFHISFIFTFLFESYYPNILIHTSIFSSILIYHQPNHLRLVFNSSFHSLLIPFNDRLSLHSFLDSKQSDSHYLVIDSIVLNFPEGTSSSYQPLICILMVLYHLTTMFSSHDFGTHHLLSFTQCLFQNGVSSTYSVTIRM